MEVEEGGARVAGGCWELVAGVGWRTGYGIGGRQVGRG